MHKLTREIKKELLKRLIDENIERTNTCIKLLGKKDIHFRPNENCNSVAMLIQHINGNIRQWLISPLTNKKFKRKRKQEFIENKNISKEDLLSITEELRNDIINTVDYINEEYLIREFTIQGFHTSGYGIVNHVTEHFSYHCGQITLLTKMILNTDTAYYAGIQLE